MATQIFVNLPVRDLNRSIAFYAALGWAHNPQFTDETAASIVISDDIYLMIVTESFFRNMTKKEVVDAAAGTEAVVALGVESKAKVDELADAALASGGSATSDPTVESFMYGRGFADPDGHQFELFHMFATPE